MEGLLIDLRIKDRIECLDALILLGSYDANAKVNRISYDTLYSGHVYHYVMKTGCWNLQQTLDTVTSKLSVRPVPWQDWKLEINKKLNHWQEQGIFSDEFAHLLMGYEFKLKEIILQDFCKLLSVPLLSLEQWVLKWKSLKLEAKEMKSEEYLASLEEDSGKLLRRVRKIWSLKLVRATRKLRNRIKKSKMDLKAQTTNAKVLLLPWVSTKHVVPKEVENKPEIDRVSIGGEIEVLKTKSAEKSSNSDSRFPKEWNSDSMEKRNRVSTFVQTINLEILTKTVKKIIFNSTGIMNIFSMSNYFFLTPIMKNINKFFHGNIKNELSIIKSTNIINISPKILINFKWLSPEPKHRKTNGKRISKFEFREEDHRRRWKIKKIQEWNHLPNPPPNLSCPHIYKGTLNIYIILMERITLVTTNGKVYHNKNCKILNNPIIKQIREIKMEEINDMNPCKNCKPKLGKNLLKVQLTKKDLQELVEMMTACNLDKMDIHFNC